MKTKCRSKLIMIPGAYIVGLFFWTVVNASGPVITYERPAETVQPVYLFPPVESLAVVSETPPHEIVRASVSAYTSSVDETDDTPEINAAGTKPGPGSIACPNRYKLGTRVLIAGNEYRCDDRMNPRYQNTNHFDIWVLTKAQAMHWGRQTVDVEVVQ